MASSESSNTHMREIVENELISRMDHIPATIFQVTNFDATVKPESYTPQMIGLGPFHHFRPEVSQMQKAKDAAIDRFLRRHLNFKRHQLEEDVLKKDEPRIRACYDKSFDFKGDSLVSMTVTDALFLSQLLLTQGQGEGCELVQNDFLRDLMMVENQIPLFLLEQIAEKADSFSSLPNKLLAFCIAVSPFSLEKTDGEYVELVQRTCPHLLCLLYILIVPIKKPPNQRFAVCACFESNFFESNFFDTAADIAEQILQAAAETSLPIPDGIKQPINVFLGLRKLPWSKLKTPFESFDISEGNRMIPPASSLAKAGVIFKPNTKDIREFGFIEEEDEAVLYLPVINLNVNSEVILRNLVAFEAFLGSSSRILPAPVPRINHSICEAMKAARTHVLARYTKIMDGILETATDVKILRDAEIIKGNLESDEDVAKLFSGMSISSGLAADDDTIKKLNNFYNNSPIIKRCKLMKKCVSILCVSLKLLVVVLLLAMMAQRTFCSVYGCSNMFKSNRVWLGKDTL